MEASQQDHLDQLDAQLLDTQIDEYLKLFSKSYNAVFSIIEEKIAFSKETTTKAINSMASLDIKDKTYLLLTLSKQIAALKSATDEFYYNSVGVDFTVTALNTGLSPEEALAKLQLHQRESK